MQDSPITFMFLLILTLVEVIAKQKSKMLCFFVCKILDNIGKQVKRQQTK